MQKLSFVPAFMSVGLNSYAQKADVAHSTSVSMTSYGITELLDQFIEPSRIINEVTALVK